MIEWSGVLRTTINIDTGHSLRCAFQRLVSSTDRGVMSSELQVSEHERSRLLISEYS